MALTITLTETAAKKIHDFMAQTGKEGYGLRMRVAGGGCSGLQYQLGIDEKAAPGDKVLESNGVPIFVDLKSAFVFSWDRGGLCRRVDGIGLQDHQPECQVHLWMRPIVPLIAKTLTAPEPIHRSWGSGRDKRLPRR